MLQNLRFAHLLYRGETIPDRESDQFNVYLLDLAQLYHQRAIEGFNLNWKKRENRRSRKLVYSASWNVESNCQNTEKERQVRVEFAPSLFDDDGIQD